MSSAVSALVLEASEWLRVTCVLLPRWEWLGILLAATRTTPPSQIRWSRSLRPLLTLSREVLITVAAEFVRAVAGDSETPLPGELSTGQVDDLSVHRSEAYHHHEEDRPQNSEIHDGDFEVLGPLNVS